MDERVLKEIFQKRGEISERNVEYRGIGEGRKVREKVDRSKSKGKNPAELLNYFANISGGILGI